MAVEHILAEEGGYVNDPQDPGGETNFGISKRSYPDLDIRRLTRADAIAIYRRDYWNRIRGDDLPAPLGLVVFDAAVNQGVGAATRFLQDALGVVADGVIGPRTLAAAAKADPKAAAVDVLVARTFHYVSLPTFRRFGKGWLRRLYRTAMAA